MNINQLEKLLKAFANQRRLAILRLLQKNKEINVTDISEKIDLSFRATSQHLRVLDNAGLVETRQESLMVFYRKTNKYDKLVRHILGYTS